jgi:acetyl esterase/lipase
MHYARGSLLALLLGVACATLAGQESALNEDSSVLTRPAGAPDATVAYGSGPDQVADVRYGGAQAERRPLVLLLHGGFWRPAYDRQHVAPMAMAIAAAGWTVASVEYRRIPGRPDATLGDVRDAVQSLPSKLTRHNGQAVLIGHSAGGHLALWAAPTSRAVTGVLALAPVADLKLAHAENLGSGAVMLFLGVDPSQRPDVDPRLLDPSPARATIVHGANDDTVPISISEAYLSSHPAVRLRRLPETGHFAVIDPLSAAWPTVLEELLALSQHPRL